MSNATKRSILRWIHIVLAIPIAGYVYSPFAELPNYAPVVRFVSIPFLILSGFWMYAGVVFAIIATVPPGKPSLTLAPFEAPATRSAVASSLRPHHPPPESLRATKRTTLARLELSFEFA